MNQGYNPRDDRYYDPPEEPDEAVCEGCQVDCFFDDLEEVNGKWLCAACVKKEAAMIAKKRGGVNGKK